MPGVEAERGNALRLRARIALLVEAATLAGHPLPIETVERLTGSRVVEDLLPAGVMVRDGVIIRRGFEYGRELDGTEIDRVRGWVKELLSRIGVVKGPLSLGLCGSLAYGSMRWDDDIDLYAVSKPGHLWIHLFRMFLALRVLALKLQISRCPFKLCLSYAVDAREMARVASSPDPLERLEMDAAIPLAGLPLKRVWQWDGLGVGQTLPRFLNLLLMAFMKPYLRFKQHIMNSRFRLRRQYGRMFRYVVGPSRFTVTSRRYEMIQRLYGAYWYEA